MNAVKVVLRPAPDIPPLPPGTDRSVVQMVDSLRVWCREAEKAVRLLEQALNEVRAKVS